MSKRADRLGKKTEESKLACNQVNCTSGQHSYSPAPKQAWRRRRLLESVGMGNAVAMYTPYSDGKCWACGDDSVDWERTRQRNPVLLDETIKYLRREFIRELYWKRPFDETALKVARNSGFENTLDQVMHRLETSLKKPRKIWYDDMITPWEGKSVIHYAQHATATCCRRCFEQWYGVPAAAGFLSTEEINFAEILIREYLTRRRADIWEAAA